MTLTKVGVVRKIRRFSKVTTDSCDTGCTTFYIMILIIYICKFDIYIGAIHNAIIRINKRRPIPYFFFFHLPTYFFPSVAWPLHSCLRMQRKKWWMRTSSKALLDGRNRDKRSQRCIYTHVGRSSSAPTIMSAESIVYERRSNIGDDGDDLVDHDDKNDGGSVKPRQAFERSRSWKETERAKSRESSRASGKRRAGPPAALKRYAHNCTPFI